MRRVTRHCRECEIMDEICGELDEHGRCESCREDITEVVSEDEIDLSIFEGVSYGTPSLAS